MNDHYYTREPQSASRPTDCEYSYRGNALRFQTDAGVFSRGEADPGSRLLLEALPEELDGDILDLGCGWGLVGVSVARAFPGCQVTMTDVNTRALALAGQNAKQNGVTAECLESDGFQALSGRLFDAVITNPPIRAGKQVIYRLFAEAKEHLKPEGSLYLVIRKQQGADSCRKYLETLFTQVEILDRGGGYRVLRAGEK